ncbi:hypothetical protein BZL41_02320 [Pseudomonas sp. PIC25]|nr:hypothetical protein BZL41_02320 [Pseudomonas sp. PIC25]
MSAGALAFGAVGVLLGLEAALPVATTEVLAELDSFDFLLASMTFTQYQYCWLRLPGLSV